MVGYERVCSPIRKVIVPGTVLPLAGLRVSVIVVIILLFMFVRIINTHEGTREGCDFAEGYEQGLMDLSLRVDIDATEEENEASKGEDGGSKQLYVEILFHGAKVV